METLKFLFTSTFYPPYHIGGDAVHVKYLAEELAKWGHEVHVLHSLDAYRVKRKRSSKRDEEAYDNVNVHTIQTSFSLSPYIIYLFGNSPAVVREFESLLREIKPDVVHHHNISLLGYNLLRKRGNYLNLYTAHDYWLICQQNNPLKNNLEICDGGLCRFCSLKRGKPPQLWRYLKGFKEAVKSIDVVIAPSNYMKQKILKYLNVKIITIPNFAPKPPNTIEVSDFSDFFLFAGVLEWHKGVTDLVRAYKEVSKRIDSKLVIVGTGSLEVKIREYIEKHRLENKVFLFGWQDHNSLYRLLKDANALIIPSIGPENCPLIAIEALSVGTPIITSNKGGLPEIVKKIDRNLIFNSIDKLKNILLNFDRNKYPPQFIKSIYEKDYSPEAFLKKYLKLVYSGLTI